MREHCLFCKRTGTSPTFVAGERLLSAQHEGASLGNCAQCGQLYLRYFVEHRDDSLDYHCQLSEEQGLRLKALVGLPGLSTEIRAIVRGQEVFFCAPWTKEWAFGSRVLVDPRPW